MLHLPVAALIQTAAQVAASNPSPFEWASQHIHLVGWPVIVALIVKATWHIGRFLSDLQAQATKTVAQIDTMATNHFPHMEASLTGQDKTLASIDSSLKTLVQLQSKS